MVAIKVAKIRFTTKRELVNLVTNGAIPKTKICLFLNPHSIVEGEKNKKYREIIRKRESLIFADGIGLKLKNYKVERVTGRDFIYIIYDSLPAGSKFLWIGGSKEKNIGFKKYLEQAGLDATNTLILDVPFRDDFNQNDIGRINKVIKDEKPDVILVCIGAPKQEVLISMLEFESASFIAGIGAVYDFISSPHQNAPSWMSACGLEWLYRLILNPKRTWKRVFISAPKFFCFH